jgi:AraC-like DNA-binding protein
MTYSELPAPRDLAHVVMSYWELTVIPDVTGPVVHEVFPDGCVTLACLRQRQTLPPLLRVVGPRLKPLRTELQAGDVWWGARLSPAAAHLVLGCAPATLFGHNLPGAFVVPQLAQWMEQRIGKAEDFAAGAAVFSAKLGALGIRPTDLDTAVAAAAHLLESSLGQAKIAEIAGAVGLSTRQLERRFRAVTGLTPKQFARLRRMYATTYALAADDTSSWATRAANFGYADQAHMTREFVSLTGRPPVSFAEMLARFEHGKMAR